MHIEMGKIRVGPGLNRALKIPDKITVNVTGPGLATSPKCVTDIWTKSSDVINRALTRPRSRSLRTDYFFCFSNI